MTDYFALLDQPRSAWLDPEQLKQAFHAKTLRAHPDVQEEQTGDDAFAELNKAYQVLRDPKRRLQHLLTLLDQLPGKTAAIPREIEELFPAVAGLTRQADAVLQKLARSTSALGLSLVRAELVRTRQEVDGMLARLHQMHGAAAKELYEVAADASETLQQLYLRFSYLTRWISELEEKKLNLGM
jgi:curved DNA-binding protein CbpA